MSRRGRIFLFPWLVLLISAILCYGSVIGGWCIGFAVALHGLSVADLVISSDELNPLPRIGWGIACLALVAAPYWFAVTQFNRVLTPRQYLADSPPFMRGDVVLYRPNAYLQAVPQAGDVVLYRNTPYTSGAYGYYNRYDGEWIDRIVAKGGSRVRWDHGQLWVDGKISPHRPLNPGSLPANLELEVPPGAYCILPSMIPTMGRELNTGGWQVLSIVNPERIEGRAVVRNYPLGRWWWIQ
jgi:hypothetical protein